MSEKRLQKRDEISDEYKWKLEDMYETDELWEAECEKRHSLQKSYPALRDIWPTVQQRCLIFLRSRMSCLIIWSV